MLRLLKQFLAPPIVESDERKLQIAAYLNIIVIAIFLGAIVVAITNASIEIFVLHTSPETLVMSLLGGSSLLFLVLYILLRLGYTSFVSITVPAVLWIAFTIPAYVFDGIRDNAIFGYFIVILIAGLVAETPVLIGFDILSILSVILIYLAETNDMITSSFDTYPPMSDVIIISVLLLVSGFLLNAVVGRISASYELARQSALDLGESNQELQAIQGILEKQTNQLERRSRHLQASSEVMREAISALEIESLLPRLAALINERFNLYRMGIFLADSTKEWVVLRAADGEDVDEELISKFRLKIGEEGIVGYVAETGNSFFTDDVREEPKFVDDPKASDVRSEVALPLRVRENIIGVLDMQSRETAAFTDEDMEILQTLADQIAMAINNARLFEQVQESLETERRAYGEISRQAWKRLLGSQDLSFFSDKESTIPAGDLWRPEMRTALHTGEIIRGEDGATLAIPIKVRDQIIGVIDGRKPDDTEWTKEKITMLETLSEQLSTALESARLYEDTQRRATRERMASDITAKMRRAAGVERIVQTALDELYKALGTSRAFIQLGTTAPTQEETVEESK